jgi:hypothetical protein
VSEEGGLRGGGGCRGKGQADAWVGHGSWC